MREWQVRDDSSDWGHTIYADSALQAMGAAIAELRSVDPRDYDNDWRPGDALPSAGTVHVWNGDDTLSAWQTGDYPATVGGDLFPEAPELRAELESVQDGWQVNYRHDAGGIMIDADWDADTSYAEIDAAVDEAATGAESEDPDAAKDYWFSACQDAATARTLARDAMAALNRGDVQTAHELYEEAASTEARYGDRPTYPPVDLSWVNGSN